MTMIEIPSADGTESVSAYRAEAVGELRGALIVIHEIWGLVDHIKHVADRFAAEGYVVIAPDLLSDFGLTPDLGAEIQRLMFSASEEERSAAQPMLREALAPTHSPKYAAEAVRMLKSVVDYLIADPAADGRIGVAGFCFGGTYSFALAAADDRIRAAVPFYGSPPATTDLAAIQCPVLALYGETDERLMESLPAVTGSMKDAGVDFIPHVYENAGHAFFNDTNSVTYRSDAAADAWLRTIEFLRGTLAPSTRQV
jgi:carboxymethylenebutenolidase